LVLDNTGAGDGVFTFRKTVTDSGTSNFLTLTGTMLAAPSQSMNGLAFTITSAGSAAQTNRGMLLTYGAGYTGSGATVGIAVTNSAAGTGTLFNGTNNRGMSGVTNPTTTGTNVGVNGSASNGDISIGVAGAAVTAKNNATNYGAVFLAANTGTTPKFVGTYIGLSSSTTPPTPVSSVLQLDNYALAVPIAVFQDNGVTQSQISDGGGFDAMVTGKDLGTTTNPWRNIVLHMSGTYGTGSWTFAGTPTGNRVLTIPGDASITLAAKGINNAFSTGQSVTGNIDVGSNVDKGLLFGAAAAPAIYMSASAQAPDAPYLATAEAVANAWHLGENADEGANLGNGACGSSVCTDPSLVIHSHNQDTTQFVTYASYGLAGQMLKTLTESSATAVVAIPVASDAATGGSLKYTVFASDGTGQQARFGEVRFSQVAEGTTSTCTVLGVDQGPAGIGGPTANPDQTEDGSGVGALTTGTLTYAWTVTAGTNLCTYNLNAVSSLTQTTLQIKYRVDLVGPGQPSPQ
jgi:hypothetical protein